MDFQRILDFLIINYKYLTLVKIFAYFPKVSYFITARVINWQSSRVVIVLALQSEIYQIDPDQNLKYLRKYETRPRYLFLILIYAI